MCIIAVKKANQNLPEEKIMERMFLNNSDGAGFCYYLNGEVIIQKALYQEFRTANTVDSIMGFIQNLCGNIACRNSGTTSENEISKKVISFVKELPDTEIKNITLMFVADKLFLSQAYISRTFKNETGMKFLDWITNEKLERSARILKDRSIKIKDVCEMMGYSNSNYFIRKFKEKYGVTPKQYQGKA